MGAKTSIEWAANADGTPGATWNPIRARDTETGKVGTFCVHASPGCINCYAEKFQARNLPNNGIGLPYSAQHLSHVEFMLDVHITMTPFRRKKPTTWFLSSMTDAFGEFIPDDMIDRLFAVMALNPQHTFIVLTKRSRRMRDYMRTPDRKRTIAAHTMALSNALAETAGWKQRIKLDHMSACFAGDGPFPNIWLVVSCEDQRRADERLPDLMETPAAVRGVSCEPLIGPIDLKPWLLGAAIAYSKPIRHRGFPPHIAGTEQRMAAAPKLDWVIVGGESGNDARPMHPQWARQIRDDCAKRSVPMFFKQFGEYHPSADHDPHTCPRARHTPEAIHVSGEQEHRPSEAFRLISSKSPGWVGMCKVGKKRAGRVLDGRTHDERPPLSIGLTP